MMRFTVNYQTELGLGNLFRRLKQGQILKGRIIDCIPPNGYLLRIRGFNILTQSKGSFEKFEEMVSAHGGSLKNFEIRNKPKFKKDIYLNENGFIHCFNTYNLGLALIKLGWDDFG